jgi:hypothetical protein
MMLKNKDQFSLAKGIRGTKQLSKHCSLCARRLEILAFQLHGRIEAGKRQSPVILRPE